MKDKPLNELISSLGADIRIEAILAVLLENETVDLDHVVVQTKGVFKRPYSKDILGVELRGKKSGKTEVLHIDISREGLYDMLPEGLFHQTMTKAFKTTEDSVAEFKQHREEEKQARNFFLPLEQEFFRLRSLSEIEERKALFAFSGAAHQGVFARFWGHQPALSRQQSAVYYFLLPLFYHIVGNLPVTALCFEAILGQPVSLQWIPPQKQSTEGYQYPLGACNLGVDFILGNTWFDEIPAIQVNIGPLKKKDLPDYLPGGSAHTVLELLYNHFLPVEVEPVLKISAKKESEPILFTEPKEAALLGYTSTI